MFPSDYFIFLCLAFFFLFPVCYLTSDTHSIAETLLVIGSARYVSINFLCLQAPVDNTDNEKKELKGGAFWKSKK